MAATWSKKRKLWLGPVEEGECPHGKPYKYRWVWRKGETEEDSEPEYVETQDCDECFSEDDDE